MAQPIVIKALITIPDPLLSLGLVYFNYELHLRCGAAGDPNSQQHACDDDLFQTLCFLWGLFLF